MYHNHVLFATQRILSLHLYFILYHITTDSISMVCIKLRCESSYDETVLTKQNNGLNKIGHFMNLTEIDIIES